MRSTCWPDALPDSGSPLAARAQRRTLARHEALYRVGDPFVCLYAVRSGSLKTCAPVRPGRMQVVGFHAPGSVVGLDGLNDQHHACDAIALEDSEVCVFAPGPRAGGGVDPARRAAQLRALLGREVARERALMVRLGSLDAEERVRAFLLELMAAQCPPSASLPELVLSMTREEIGSYLGLTIETVSRTLSRLAARQWISVCGRHVRILYLPGLLGQTAPELSGS